ncbi:MAG TPA: hypothetical protein VGR22_03980 [Thermomicrobiales bacterium]|nr:hypothetical protein [Thermomicrobiales bacterium]
MDPTRRVVRACMELANTSSRELDRLLDVYGPAVLSEQRAQVGTMPHVAVGAMAKLGMDDPDGHEKVAERRSRRPFRAPVAIRQRY